MENLKQHFADTWPLYAYTSCFVFGGLRLVFCL